MNDVIETRYSENEIAKSTDVLHTAQTVWAQITSLVQALYEASDLSNDMIIGGCSVQQRSTP